MNTELRYNLKLQLTHTNFDEFQVNSSDDFIHVLQFNISPSLWKKANKSKLMQNLINSTFALNIHDKLIIYIYLVSFLTNLIELDASENEIIDISSISQLKDLVNLNLERNYIEDISVLQSITKLRKLNISCNQITSYSLALPLLEELEIYHNALDDLSGLQHSPLLTRLSLMTTKTKSIYNLAHLTKLTSLDLSNNLITDVNPISNLINLTSLELGSCSLLKNIEPLKHCTQIQFLTIDETSISDIWSLSFMKDLETLYAWQTEIVDLHPLQYLHSLVHINLNESKVIDVTPLKNLDLDELFIGANRVQSFLPIQHHKNFYCNEPINDEFDPKYSLTDQEVPTDEELKFYNKILSVHSSQKQIREIKNENRITKFRTSFELKRSYVSVMLNNQIMTMNTQLEILVQFMQKTILAANLD
ncbi:Conserved_hypothetical protein [Hexamita inflata]|uniref:Uncharacterized protein n=1 Tax=Hexamita inflata TaxID=28002 RepID=A0AA86NSH4_9EUKA|nr:Conserved hypothetical protein [Hexamita inflata]